MAIDTKLLAESAFDAALAAAKGQAKNVKTYAKKRAKIIAEGAVALAKDRIAGHIDNDDVKFAWEQIRLTERSARLAVQVATRAALQDAINAALAVAAGAVNQAVGIKVI